MKTVTAICIATSSNTNRMESGSLPFVDATAVSNCRITEKRRSRTPTVLACAMHGQNLVCVSTRRVSVMSPDTNAQLHTAMPHAAPDVFAISGLDQYYMLIASARTVFVFDTRAGIVKVLLVVPGGHAMRWLVSAEHDGGGVYGISCGAGVFTVYAFVHTGSSSRPVEYTTTDIPIPADMPMPDRHPATRVLVFRDAVRGELVVCGGSSVITIDTGTRQARRVAHASQFFNTFCRVGADAVACIPWNGKVSFFSLADGVFALAAHAKDGLLDRTYPIECDFDLGTSAILVKREASAHNVLLFMYTDEWKCARINTMCPADWRFVWLVDPLVLVTVSATMGRGSIDVCDAVVFHEIKQD